MGLFYDLIVLIYLGTCVAFINLFVPDKALTSRANIIGSMLQYAVAIFVLLFAAVAEFFFWDEFTARFNSFAVDYLVYTQEVLANIWQSYPVVWIIIATALLSVLVLKVTWPMYRIAFKGFHTSFLKRLAIFAILQVCPCCHWSLIMPGRSYQKTALSMNCPKTEFTVFFPHSRQCPEL